MVDDWAAAALDGGQVPTCSGEAGFAVQAVRTPYLFPKVCQSERFHAIDVAAVTCSVLLLGHRRRKDISEGREAGGGRRPKQTLMLETKCGCPFLIAFNPLLVRV